MKRFTNALLVRVGEPESRSFQGSPAVGEWKPMREKPARGPEVNMKKFAMACLLSVSLMSLGCDASSLVGSGPTTIVVRLHSSCQGIVSAVDVSIDGEFAGRITPGSSGTERTVSPGQHEIRGTRSNDGVLIFGPVVRDLPSNFTYTETFRCGA